MVGIIVYIMTIVTMTLIIARAIRGNEELCEEKAALLESYAELAARHEKAIRDMPANEHAKMLGQTVMAKVYEGSEWERMVVVAVSWHGSVAVRPLSDLATKARWIHRSKVPDRVREIQQ